MNQKLEHLLYRSIARSTAAATITAGVALAVATAGTPAIAAPVPSGPIDGGSTTIFLDSHTAKAMAKHNYTIEATGSATLKKDELTLQVTGGHYNQGGVVKHSGGFKISDGSAALKVKNITFKTATHKGTASVGGNRIHAFVLGDPNTGDGTPHTVTYGGYTLDLAKPLFKKLDNKLSAGSFFAHHTLLGVGSTTMHFAK
jgi:hypothetical protein